VVFFKKNKKFLLILACLAVFITSIVLGLHNGALYSPRHGFDGAGHVEYVEYLYKNRKIPPPTGYETHQPPLYYAIGAVLMFFTNTSKTAQYVNTFVLWMIIGVVGLGLKKVFKKRTQVLIGMFALAALPMLNIFPAMLTNELLNTFWIISATVSTLYLVSSKNKKGIVLFSLWLVVSLILGVWTKISIITVLPTVVVAFILFLLNKKSDWKTFLITETIVVFLFIVFAAPVYIRGKGSSGPTDVGRMTSKIKNMRPLDFYFRLDWIPRVDTYNTQYYSLLGGAWNSFWSDGHNAITPFVKFHKKAFVLWSLGFILLPICLYGLRLIWKVNEQATIIIYSIGAVMLGMYVVYNNISGHYSAARLTYEMGIVVPYSFGIAGASLNKKLKPLILILLTIQFIIMVSFFWILSWWHVTK